MFLYVCKQTFANFTGKNSIIQCQESETFRVLFLYEHEHIGRVSNLHQVTFKIYGIFGPQIFHWSVVWPMVVGFGPSLVGGWWSVGWLVVAARLVGCFMETQLKARALK